MTKIFSNFIILFICTLLFSCSSLKKDLGIEKDLPNEFLIKKREPLKLPPDYKIIKPKSENPQISPEKDNSLKKIFEKNLEEKNIIKNNNTDLENIILDQIK